MKISYLKWTKYEDNEKFGQISEPKWANGMFSYTVT